MTSDSATYLGISVGDWVRAARDPDPLVRRLAVYALGMIGPAVDEAGAATLGDALADAQPFVRLWAAAALARVRPGEPRVSTALVEAMHQGAPFLRSLGAWQLGRLGPDLPGVGPALARLDDLRDDPDPNVRIEAELALRAIRGNDVRQRG